jgi:hypothetical protein
MEIIVKDVAGTEGDDAAAPLYCYCYCSYYPYLGGNKSKVQRS